MSFLSKICRPLSQYGPGPGYLKDMARVNYKKPSKPWTNFNNTKEHRRRLWIMNAGVLATVFGLCYCMVPFYRMFCETTGLIGDTDKKDYSEVLKRMPKANVHRKYKVVFKSDIDPELEWTFDPVQEEVIVNAGEPALMFYDAYNKSDDPKVGIALYSIYPEDAGYYFSKIQCFCFNQQALAGKERLNMPLFFYLEPEIDSDPLLKDVKEVRVVYKFYLAKNQELADWIKKQQAWEFEQKNFLREKRLQKIKSEGGDSTTLEQEAELDAVLMKEALPDFTLGKLSPNSITN